MSPDVRGRKAALLLVPVLLVLINLAAPESRAQGSPDIAISDADLSASRMDPLQGEPFVLYARVRNIGNASGNATVRFYLGDMPADWSSAGERNVSIGAGGSAIASVNLTLPAGIYRLTAQALNVTPQDADPGNQLASLTIEVFQSRQGAVFAAPTLLLEGTNATVFSGDATLVSLNVTAKGGRVLGASLEVLGATGLLATPVGMPVDMDPDQRVRLDVRVVAPDLLPGVNRSEMTLLVHATASNARGNTAEVGVAVVAAPLQPSSGAPPWASATVIGVSLGLVGLVAAVASIESWRYRFLFLLLPLYSRLRKEEVLDQYTRGKIHGYLVANPGDYFTSIARALGVSGGVLTYHLRVLERQGAIVSRQDGVHKRFYPAGARIDDASGPGLSPIQRSVCRVVQETPGIKQKDIASFLGVSAATVSYHLRRLIAWGLVQRARRGMAVRYFPETRAAEHPQRIEGKHPT